jgi:hypothetical protein
MWSYVRRLGLDRHPVSEIEERVLIVAEDEVATAVTVAEKQKRDFHGLANAETVRASFPR